MQTKTCYTCKEIKPLKDFGLRSDNQHPLAYCRSCVSKRSQEWYLKNREKALAYHREYHIKNKDK